MQLVSDSHPSQIDAPEWSDIEAAIRNLDGHNHTEVSLFENEDCYLQIGGGGECLVCGIRQGGDLYILTDPIRSPTSMKWVVAGQGSHYPENECFGKEDILSVTRFFFANKSRPLEYHWKSY